MGIGRKFQKPTVFESHTVAGHILLALKGPRGPFFGALRPAQPCAGADIDRILTTVRLIDHRNRLAGDLSHGQKQWLEIGMLLAQRT